MDEAFNSKSPKARLVRALRSWIDEGVLERGVPIPSERELCKRLGANQSTLQKALGILEDEKLILRKGPRTRIVSRAKRQPSRLSSFSSTAVILTDMLPLAPLHCGGMLEAILDGILDGLVKEGLHALIFNRSRVEIELGAVLGQNPFGILSVDRDPLLMPLDGIFTNASQLGVPSVAYGDGESLKAFDRVCSDHECGSFELANGLLALGCKRIMMIKHSDLGIHPWVMKRQSGMERALRGAGLEPVPPLIGAPFATLSSLDVKDKARLHASYLTEHFAAHGKPDAIMTISDGDVCPVALACRMLGLEPGKDVVIVGYDNYWRERRERGVETYIPPLTVDKRNFTAGMEMAGLLMQRRNGELPNEPQLRLIKPELVKTSSFEGDWQ